MDFWTALSLHIDFDSHFTSPDVCTPGSFTENLDKSLASPFNIVDLPISFTIDSCFANTVVDVPFSTSDLDGDLNSSFATGFEDECFTVLNCG